MDAEKVERMESIVDKVIEILLNSKVSYSEAETILRVARVKIGDEVIRP